MPMNKLSRRELIQLGISALLADWLRPFASLGGKAFALEDKFTGALARNRSNFHWFYNDEKKAKEFLPFLENVFHLYPADRFQKMITEATLKFRKDPEIYAEVLRRLSEIKPFLSEFTYALPALKVQKQELRRQTLELLGPRRKVDGYLEMGAPARYLSALKDGLQLSGPAYIFHDAEPSYSPSDIVERGQISKLGKYVALGNYNYLDPAQVPNESLDLITNFIGFHHCPANRKREFILSLKQSLRKGGRLLLRDHDVTDENMDVLVGLAHDVFNAGLTISWTETSKQIRNFQSLAEIERELTELGFRREGGFVYQKGDPTRNALMQFVRIS